MAPRRGGGGGGGDGGSGTGLNSPWSDEIWFDGSRFSDPLIRGAIIIQGICAFALLVIAVAAALVKKTAVSSKKTSGSTRKIFAWSRYGFSITMAIMWVTHYHLAPFGSPSVQKSDGNWWRDMHFERGFWLIILQSIWIQLGFIHYSWFADCGATDLPSYRGDPVRLLLSVRDFSSRNRLLVVDVSLSNFHRAAKGRADKFHTGP